MKKILLLITTAIVVLLSSCSDDVEMPEYEGNFPDIIGTWVRDSTAVTGFDTRGTQDSYDAGDTIISFHHASYDNDDEVTFIFYTDYSIIGGCDWNANWTESDSIIYMHFLTDENDSLTFDWRVLELTEDFMILDFDDQYYFYHKR